MVNIQVELVFEYLINLKETMQCTQERILFFWVRFHTSYQVWKREQKRTQFGFLTFNHFLELTII